MPLDVIDSYTANMMIFIVEGEALDGILSTLLMRSKLAGSNSQIITLSSYHNAPPWLALHVPINFIAGNVNSIRNHFMSAVIGALREKGCCE